MEEAGADSLLHPVGKELHLWQHEKQSEIILYQDYKGEGEEEEGGAF